VIFFFCCWFGPERKLYGVMFTLALALEIGGTALGTWAWVPVLPGLNFSGANPPVAAGVFYALLDLLVRAGERLLSSKTEANLMYEPAREKDSGNKLWAWLGFLFKIQRQKKEVEDAS